MKLVRWGHDWVNLCLIVVNPWWAPSKVFALPICMRLYRNKQGVTKGKAKGRGGSKKKAAPSTKRQKKQAKRAERKRRKIAARQRKGVANRKKTSDSTHIRRPELMREMLRLVASWFPDRPILFVGDSLYTGESVLKHLPENVDMIGAVHPKGALYEPAPKKQSGRGAPRKKGKRLPTYLATLAA